MKSLRGTDRIQVGGVFGKWDDAVGANVAAHVRPVKLDGGTLVVEAARRSGSLITARFAAEQGREVFAIPGSIHNPLSRGCHQLIKQGAKLVETADDIVAELAPLVGHMLQLSVQSTESPTESAELDAGHSELLQLLGHDPTSPDELAERSGLTIDQVSSILLILELEGKIEKLSGGRYSVLS